MNFSLSEAVKSLHPTAEFVFHGTEYSGLIWLSKDITKPTEAELKAECDALEAKWAATEYQRNRAAEYPPVADFLDAIVKGDETQKQAYIDACLAVKAKYPKPEGV